MLLSVTKKTKSKSHDKIRRVCKQNKEKNDISININV